MRWAALVYGCLAALGVALTLALGLPAPWSIAETSGVATSGVAPLAALVVGDRAWLLHAVSLVAGLALGGVTVASTPFLVARYAWARELHASLRPMVSARGVGALLLLAFASGVSEELFFRGLLVQLVGLVPSAIGFGLLHQVRGSARWVWAAWATAMGLCLGGIFVVTGSLLGPIVAHVLVNAQNLRFLRDHEVERPRRRLGGILGSA